MILAIQRLADALSVGSTYALLALGLTLVYGVMNLINFAYGMMLVWTALLAVLLIDHGIPIPLVVFGCVSFAILLSVATGWIAFRPFLTAAPVTLLITSFGVELVLQYAAILAFGNYPLVLQIPSYLNEVLHLGSLRIPKVELITIGTSVIVIGCLWYLLQRTSFGIEIRATAEKPEVARLMGIRPSRILVVVFAISGAIAGIAGLLWFAKVGALTARSDLDPTIKAFVAIVLGGLGNTRGAVVGGLALGGLEVLMSSLLPDAALGYTDAIVFVSVIGILLLRPGGLIGASTRL